MLPDLSMIRDGSVWKVGGGTPILARWVTDFDCGYETGFYACILDEPFQPQELKAKRRYEITRGRKNFSWRRLGVSDLDAMYDVYVESLEGYKNHSSLISLEIFKRNWEKVLTDYGSVLLGVFERNDGLMCGFAHCIKHERYIPISTLKTRVSKEKNGVNFALVDGICEYYSEDLKNGCYLCDGYRNLVHETHFQDWLEKYFQFHKAYCVLHIKYRKPVGIGVKILYPFRGVLKKKNSGFVKKVNTILLMEEWKRQCNSAKDKH